MQGSTSCSTADQTAQENSKLQTPMDRTPLSPAWAPARRLLFWADCRRLPLHLDAVLTDPYPRSCCASSIGCSADGTAQTNPPAVAGTVRVFSTAQGGRNQVTRACKAGYRLSRHTLPPDLASCLSVLPPLHRCCCCFLLAAATSPRSVALCV